MKRLIVICAAVSLALFFTPAVQAQSNQLMQGTQVKLVLLNGLSTSVARDGDPFTAIVAEPVFLGNQMVLPAGAKVHGQVGSIVRPKRFSIFRGQAAMSLQFRSIEVDGREIPAQMSILSIYRGGSAEGNKTRKDVHTVEGVVVEAKRDIKADVADVGIGTAGGSVVGVVFSHVLRGTVIGLVGGTAYIMEKKGKDVELPAQTGLLVRMDSTVALPTITAQAVLRSTPEGR
jgi:hypothetical protein